jgi:hypothetical protein
MRRNYLGQFLISLDQVLNTVLAGWADETLSARAYRSSVAESPKPRWIKARKAIDTLFAPQDWFVKRRGEWTGARHCEREFMKEMERRQMPPEYRT